MVIKPFAKKPQLPANYEDISWAKLQTAVDAVASRRALEGGVGLEELYQCVENLCLHKMAKRLYARLRDECERHISRAVDALASPSSPSSMDDAGAALAPNNLLLQQPDALFLSRLEATWFDHVECAHTLRAIFLVLDRSFAMAPSSSSATTPALAAGHGGVGGEGAHAAALPVLDLCLDLLRSNIRKRPEVERKITSALLSQVAADRRGEAVNFGALRNVLHMLSALKMYEDSFASPFLRDAAAFFQQEGNALMEASSTTAMAAGAFLRHCERRLAQVNEQVVRYLDVSTRRPLVSVVEANLLKPHAASLLNHASNPPPSASPSAPSSSSSSSSLTGFDQLMDAATNSGGGGEECEQGMLDLRRLLTLFQRLGSDAVTEVRHAFHRYCLRVSSEVLVTADKETIAQLLTLKERLEVLLAGAFRQFLPEFKPALKDALEQSVNNDNASQSEAVGASRVPELMARFVDGKLRGEKGVSEVETETTLRRTMDLFKLVRAKDVFEAFYKSDLAKRLLARKSTSTDLEQSMISKLKAECGANFTSKLEGMFKDLSLSDDLMAHFSEWRKAAAAAAATTTPATGDGTSPPSCELTVRVLTVGYWPAYPSQQAGTSGGSGVGSNSSHGTGPPTDRDRLHPSQLVLPPCLVAAQAEFMSFYGAKYQGRRLMWPHSLGQCLVKAQWPVTTPSSSGGGGGCRKELDVSLHQALVLCAFNSPTGGNSGSSSSSSSSSNPSGGIGGGNGPKQQQLTVRQLSLATGMELGSAELKGTLQSLTGSKAKLLIKITDKTGGGGNDGDDNDGGDALVYAVNASFSSKLFRIKVGAVAASGLSAASKAAACQAESEKVLAHVSRDRGYAIDACLVRIMKARKTLTHPLLVAECFSQVKFPATGPEVKKRIESLLEREYLERDESDPNKYNYLA